MGLGTQGAVLGAEDPFSSLILSTDLGATEESGGSQGAVLPPENAKAGATGSPDMPVEPVGVLLEKSSLPAASAFVRSPANAVDNVNQPVEKSGVISDGTLSEAVAGHVQFASGVVSATDKSGRIRTLLKDNVINEGDTLVTSTAAAVQIAMEDGGSITLRPQTRLKFDSFKFNGKEDGTERSFISLFQGGFRAVTGLIGKSNKQNYRITSPAATVGVLGTDHDVVYLAEDIPGAAAGVYNRVNAGATILTTDVGSVRVGLNQMGYAAGMYKLPQIQPVIQGLFTDNPVPDTGVAAGSPVSSPSPASTSAAASQLSRTGVTAPTNVVVSNGEAQKNGEVKYSVVPKKVGPTEEVGSLRGFKFGLAPIFWGGDLAQSISKRSTSEGSSNTQNSQRVNLRAASYIWQPWLARVRGSIGLVNSKSTSSAGAGGVDTSGSVLLVGSGALALFPRSRFPFDASFRVDDSRSTYGLSPSTGSVYKSLDVRQSYRPLSGTSTSLATYGRTVSTTRYLTSKGGGDTVSARWALRHDYRPRTGNSKYGVGYDRNVWNTAEGSGNASWGMQGNYTTTFDKQSLGVDARRSENFYALDGTDFRSNGIIVRHGYRPDPLLSFSSSASVDQSALRSDQSYNTRYLQASTSSNWQPDRDLPLYVNAGGRIYDSSYERLGVLYASQSQSVSAGARYAHTRNLSYALDGSVVNSKTDGVSNRTMAESGSVNYTADQIKLGDASYSRNANAGVNFQSNTTSQSNRTVSGTAGHGLRVPYLLDGGAAMDLGVEESIVARNDRINGQNRTLSHAGNASWRPVQRGTLSGGVTADVRDIRDVGEDEESLYQAAALGVNALNQTSAISSMKASASLQWTGNGTGQYSNSASANVEYKHLRAFDVSGLRYELTFVMNEWQSRNSDPQIAPTTTSSAALDQNLDYQIGRANVRLSLGLARYGRARSKVIMLHLGRSFGNL